MENHTQSHKSHDKLKDPSTSSKMLSKSVVGQKSIVVLRQNSEKEQFQKLILTQFLEGLSEQQKQDQKLVRLIEDQVTYFFTYHQQINEAGLKILQQKVNQMKKGNFNYQEKYLPQQEINESKPINGIEEIKRQEQFRPKPVQSNSNLINQQQQNEEISIINLSDIHKLQQETPINRLEQIIQFPQEGNVYEQKESSKPVHQQVSDSADFGSNFNMNSKFNFDINTKLIQENFSQNNEMPFIISPRNSSLNKKSQNQENQWMLMANYEAEQFKKELELKQQQSEETHLQVRKQLEEQINFQQHQHIIEQNNEELYLRFKEQDRQEFLYQQAKQRDDHKQLIQETSEFQRKQMQDARNKKDLEKRKEKELQEFLTNQSLQSQKFVEQEQKEKILQEKQRLEQIRIQNAEIRKNEEIQNKFLEEQMNKKNQRYNQKLSDLNANNRKERLQQLNQSDNVEISKYFGQQNKDFEKQQNEDHLRYIKTIEQNTRLQIELKKQKEFEKLETRKALIAALDKQLEDKQKMEEQKEYDNNLFHERLKMEVDNQLVQEKLAISRKKDNYKKNLNEIQDQIVQKQMANHSSMSDEELIINKNKLLEAGIISTNEAITSRQPSQKGIY